MKTHPAKTRSIRTTMVVVVETGGSPASHTAFDGFFGKWIEAGYDGHPDGFPTPRTFTSVSNPEVQCRRQPYDQSNALRLTTGGAGGRSSGRMYETVIDLAAPGPDSRTLTHLEFTKPGIGATTGILAVSGEAAVEAPLELTIGFHVSWPSDAEGYDLEEAEPLDGPRSSTAGTLWSWTCKAARSSTAAWRSRSPSFRLSRQIEPDPSVFPARNHVEPQQEQRTTKQKPNK